MTFNLMRGMNAMVARHTTTGKLIAATCMVATLAGCATTPLGPSVQVMPGRGKSFDTFQIDQAGCKSFAGNQVKGQAEAANTRAVGTALLTTVLGAGLGAAVGGVGGDAGAGAAIGAAAGAGGGSVFGAGNSSNDQMSIQQQYDNAFAQCMYAKGEQVPGFAPSAAMAPLPSQAAAPDPLVRSTQSELIRLGYLKDNADGYVGGKTRSAISVFEQGNGLPVDGSPSPRLLARLQSTPTGASTATASSAIGWVAPAGSPTGASSATASSASGWVAPTGTPTPAGTPTIVPAAATAPTGWVAPTKTP